MAVREKSSESGLCSVERRVYDDALAMAYELDFVRVAQQSFVDDYEIFLCPFHGLLAGACARSLPVIMTCFIMCQIKSIKKIYYLNIASVSGSRTSFR